jgi:hypothetical protein
MSNGEGGARFVDENKEERGWATKVVKRERALGRLVILDITTADPDLLKFLRGLDRSPLHVHQTGSDGASFRFAWASGYENGPTVRVQGILQDG